MALTLTCARCHDHKYDPISQQEFYELFAFFNSVEETGVLHPRGKFGVNTPPILKVLNQEQKRGKRIYNNQSSKRKLPSRKLREVWILLLRNGKKRTKESFGSKIGKLISHLRIHLPFPNLAVN